MARINSGRPVEVSMAWDEKDPMTVADLIDFAERLKKGRVAREQVVKLEWELVDRQDTYTMSVKG